jgi:hypothetical protein
VTSTTPETIKAARKPYRCDWCDERIEVGGSYVRWRYFDARDAVTCRLHPECRAAQNRWVREDSSWNTEWTPGDFARGCTCAAGNCECQKAAAVAKGAC